MNKIIFTALIASAISLSLTARSKFDAATQMLVNSFDDSHRLESTLKAIPVKAPASDNCMTFILLCEPSISIDEITALGADVEVITPRSMLVTVPLDRLNAIAELDGVISINANLERNAEMEKARKATFALDVHNGTGLDQPYKGEGVITGLMDTGLDPGHLNFWDSESGDSRVKRYWLFTGTNGKFNEYDSDSAPFAPTDDSSESHGTHVAGIMAGGYDGNALKLATIDESNRVVVKNDADIPFYGMAPKSDIVINAGQLYDGNILQAVVNAITYARAEGKPLVFNLSIGDNSGPHDGTDVLSRILADMGENAIICMSAGNEGDIPLAVRKTFSDDDATINTLVTGNKTAGIVDAWSADERPFELSWFVYDTARDEIVASFDANNSAQGKTFYFGNSNKSYISDPAFDNHFSGYITLMSQLDPNSNRWHIYTTTVVDPNSKVGRYRLGVRISGQSGQHVDLYGNPSTTFTDDDIPGFDDGQTNGTINGMACGKNVIAVGSYATATSWGTLGGTRRSILSTNGEGRISRFSSWGELHDGRRLPHVCGPGEVITSSISSHYARNMEVNNMVASARGIASNTDYWDIMQGTSMSSPAVAGIIALWLEANPHLTHDQVVEILEKTSIRDNGVNGSGNDIAWGAGKINALEGLKYAKALASIDLPSTDISDRDFIVTTDGSSIDAALLGANGFTLTLFNIQGSAVSATTTDGDTATLSSEGLAPGIYVAVAESTAGRHSRKVVVK